MNLDRLRLFVTVTKVSSQAEAARILHLTQPAISRGLHLLEDEIGATLFERAGRTLRLTAAGRALLPRAEELLESAERMRREVERSARRDYYDVRIGTVDSIATYLLPGVLDALVEELPELAVKLTTSRSADLLEKLERGDLDLAVVAWSGTPPGEAVRIGRYDLQFYGRADRFGDLEQARTEADLRPFPIVQIEALPGQPSMVRDDTGSYAVARSLASVKALVLGGFGVGALLNFMLSGAERSQLTRARIPHDPDCALFALGSGGVVRKSLVRLLRRELRRGRADR